jgi:hypothetical protein
MHGYHLPVDFHNGITCLMICHKNEQVASLPLVFMTSDIEYDPTSYNNSISSVIGLFDASVDTVHHSNFDEN